MASNLLYLVRLDSIRKTATGADARIAEFILANLGEMHNFTVQSLADETGTGYATVCRFLKKLGTSGFKEFKRILTEELRENEGAYPEMLEFNIESDRFVPFDHISKKICDFSMGIIGSCYKILKPATIERIVTLMKNAEQIQFMGLGASAVTAYYAYTKFSRLKPVCSNDTDLIVAKMKASQLHNNCILFAISSSGRTQTILDIADLARKGGATVISLCDFVNSPLANRSDISICTTVRESNKYIDIDYPLIQGQVTIVDVLYAALYNRTPEYSSPRIQKTRDAVRRDKTR